MKLVWSPAAARNVDAIWEYVALDNLDAADGVIERLKGAAENLRIYPRMGRSGRVRGTRELAVPGTPYIVIYRASRTAIEIVRVLHGRRDWQA